jgi:hypothetical protein
VTIGTDGFPIISHRDPLNLDLRIVHCRDAACTTNDPPRTLDATGDVGSYTSITIGSDGLPVVSYRDVTNTDLKLVHCTNTACTANDTPRTVDAGGDVGEYTSITIGADGFPVISYHDSANRDLMLVHCTNVACTANDTPRVLDSTGFVGRDNSITIGPDGFAIISYEDATNGDLKVVHCTNTACTTNDAPRTIDSTGSVGSFTSIAVGSDGVPVISYYDTTNGDLRFVRCTDTACTANDSPRVIDSTGSVGVYGSITIGSDGLATISYSDATNADLKVAHCTNTACTTVDPRRTIDATGNVGQYTAITIAADGFPVISYWDATNARLKIVHCSNESCVPFHRQR